ncbi:hypothetical protein DPEC_G00214880 [Dallia pectoralis]|uniref:Uncharacterized protein n=1 Tax=Dallia pectoralis TaxID=75939 RepID=A0ACC2G1T6_DALPE|nr:hypothetical protein DPEC_G00214880 [Dallia pectoralis]
MFGENKRVCVADVRGLGFLKAYGAAGAECVARSSRTQRRHKHSGEHDALFANGVFSFGSTFGKHKSLPKAAAVWRERCRRSLLLPHLSTLFLSFSFYCRAVEGRIKLRGNVDPDSWGGVIKHGQESWYYTETGLIDEGCLRVKRGVGCVSAATMDTSHHSLADSRLTARGSNPVNIHSRRPPAENRHPKPIRGEHLPG